jgi:hypothetical protein
VVARAAAEAAERCARDPNWNPDFGRERKVRTLPKDISALRRKLRADAYGPRGMDFAKQFKRMDRNGDGSLSWDEFSARVRKLAKLDKRDMRALRRVMDSNCDGEVNLEEFTAFLEPEDDAVVAEAAARAAAALETVELTKQRQRLMASAAEDAVGAGGAGLEVRGTAAPMAAPPLPPRS